MTLANAPAWELYSKPRRRLFLAVLFLVSTSNYVDRQIVSILLPAIKAEFKVSDAALGLLSGASFAVFYATLGIPVARWADRGDRRVIIAVDRFETATTQRVTRINRKWAGLRSFVADRTPVVGFAPGGEGFFWIAGQGGYGIQASPAIADVAAALILGRPIPADIADEGVDEAALAPDR